MTNDKWKMENEKSTIRKRRADALLLRPSAPLSTDHCVCYTLNGSLEWVGRLLALVISGFKSQDLKFTGSETAGARGKSEHRRATDWLTARRGDPTTSATENKPADRLGVLGFQI